METELENRGPQGLEAPPVPPQPNGIKPTGVETLAARLARVRALKPTDFSPDGVHCMDCFLRVREWTLQQVAL